MVFLGCFPLAPSLLNCNCLPDAAKSSSRTTTRRRCQILCYIEMVDGAHFSQSLLRCLRTGFSVLNLSSEPLITSLSVLIDHSFFGTARSRSRSLNFS